MKYSEGIGINSYFIVKIVDALYVPIKIALCCTTSSLRYSPHMTLFVVPPGVLIILLLCKLEGWL